MTDLESINRPCSSPPLLPAPHILTATRLSDSIRLGGSVHSLEVSYPSHMFEGHRDFYSSLSREKSPDPVCDGCQDEDSLPQRSYNEGIASASCYHSSHGEDGLQVWKDSHSFGSHREINKLGDRRSFGAQCTQNNLSVDSL